MVFKYFDPAMWVSLCPPTWGPASTRAWASAGKAGASTDASCFSKGQSNSGAHVHVDSGWDQGGGPEEEGKAPDASIYSTPNCPHFTDGCTKRAGGGLRSHRRWPGSGATCSRAPVSLQTLWRLLTAMPSRGRWTPGPAVLWQVPSGQGQPDLAQVPGPLGGQHSIPTVYRGLGDPRESALHGSVMNYVSGVPLAHPLSFRRGQRTSLFQPRLTVLTQQSQPFSIPGLVPGGWSGGPSL